MFLVVTSQAALALGLAPLRQSAAIADTRGDSAHKLGQIIIMMFITMGLQNYISNYIYIYILLNSVKYES